MTTTRPEDLVSAPDAVRMFGIERDQITLWESQRLLKSVRTLTGIRYRLSELTPLVHELRARTERIDFVPEAPEPRRPTRSDARRRALELLHAGDVAGGAVTVADDVPDFARALVEGVTSHRDEIDDVIRARAEHWSIERMPVVDRNLLRIGIFELLFTDTPAGAVIDEAVSLAKLLSTEESGRFVNGLLGRVARSRGDGPS